MTKQRLTPKQAAFAAAYVETGNAAEAYRRAYNVRPGTRQETVWDSASKLLAHPAVAQRVDELQAETASRQEITIESLSVQLQQARAVAIARGQSSAAVSAIMGLAKLHGLIVDKAEVSTTRHYVVSRTPKGMVAEDGPPQRLTPEEWEAKWGAPQGEA